MRPSMWANRKKRRTPCIIVLTDETRRPAVVGVADVELAVRPLDSDQ
jgi:hypothetical protein